MVIEGDTLWLTIDELTLHLSFGERASFEHVQRKGCYRGGTSWVSRPYITTTSRIQIDLDSIPDRTREKYRIPTKADFIQRQNEVVKQRADQMRTQVEATRSELSNAIAIDPELSAWYLNRFKGVKFASQTMWKKVAKDYPRLASWMIMINRMIDLSGKWSRNQTNIDVASAYGFEDVPALLAFIRDLINREDLHNFSISNERKFIDKLKPFTTWLQSAADGSSYQEQQQLKEAALESLISKKFGVTNNTKFSEWHINQLIKLARFGNQPQTVTLWNNLNVEARKRGYDEVSYETLRLHLSNKPVMNRLRLAYEGHMKWMNKHAFTITTEGASAPDVLWFGDGETVELYWWDGKQLRRENYCVVMDDFSRKIIGWARGTESHDTVYKSVKAAIENRGTVAWQFKTDKGPGYKGTIIEDFFDTVFGGGYGHTPATTGLARAKAIEPMFARFRQQILAHYVNHSFGNITSEGPQANPEFIKAHLHEFPTNAQQLDNQLSHAIEQWNERPHEEGRNAGKTPNELYEYEYDERKHVSDLWMTDKFWLWKKKPSTYEAHGLKIEWNKQEHHYLAPVAVRADSSEEDLRKVAQFLSENAGRRFDVKFNPDDLDRVALYFNGAFMCYAYNKIKTKRALFDTTADDSKILHQYWRVRELQEADIQDFYSKNDHYVEANSLTKAPMMLSSKKQRQNAETKIKSAELIPTQEQREEVMISKYAGLNKWE
jgi:hypothetical protein